MNYEQAYQWLHGDRAEYSGCRAAAEAMEAEVKRLRDALTTIYHQAHGAHPSEWGLCVAAVEARAKAAIGA